ncbi:MAG: ABC transporter ATP-binding protein, partial [Chloroflexi bacterium]|nr:ABC transporter ATP-binding protein [Chloroflexota bacterium]
MLSKFDFKNTISDNRLLGLYRMLTGFRLAYLGAMVGVGIAVALQTGNSLLLRYLVDDVLGQGRFDRTLLLVGLGFVALALGEGTLTFLSGRWAAQTAESIALRLRNYLYDHIQRMSFTYHDHTETGELIQRATSDVDAVRRFFADQAINAGRIGLLFAINFVALASLNVRLALHSIVV